MPVFTNMEFLEPGGSIPFGASTLLWPYAVPQDLLISTVKEQIPAGELAVRRGAKVEATDGRVGQVDEFLIDPSNGQISHLILREGHLWASGT